MYSKWRREKMPASPPDSLAAKPNHTTYTAAGDIPTIRAQEINEMPN
jgi:hypothetical protein